VVALERRIQFAQQGGRALVLRADDDAVRAHEVLDRRALLRNSGLETTLKGIFLFLSFKAFEMASETLSAVPPAP
jgi:hypothetical protein